MSYGKLVRRIGGFALAALLGASLAGCVVYPDRYGYRDDGYYRHHHGHDGDRDRNDGGSYGYYGSAYGGGWRH